MFLRLSYVGFAGVARVLLLASLLFVPATNLDAQSDDLQFEQLTTANGLSHNDVRAICQDYRGFMWFGTQDGLNRYDGWAFRIYRNSVTDGSTLSGNDVHAIYEDCFNNLWISTGNAVDRYLRDKDQFARYPTPGFVVHCFSSDSTGILWVGTDRGLYQFDTRTGQFTRIDLRGKDDIKALADDHNGCLWVGTPNGTMRLEKQSLHVETLCPWSLSIYIDREKTLWLASGSAGLYRFDITRDSPAARPLKDGNSHFGVASSICEDSTGRIWCGTYDQGLKLFDRSAHLLGSFKNKSTAPRSLSSSWVEEIYIDRQGNSWVATPHGVNLWSRWKKPFRHFVNDTESLNSIVAGEVRTVIQDSRNDVWIGTWGGGLAVLEHGTNRFRNYEHNASRNFNSFVTLVYEDRGGSLWIATDSDDGVIHWNRKSDSFTKYVLDSPGKPKNGPNVMLEDSRGNFWIGTDGGLCIFDRKSHARRWYAGDMAPGALAGSRILEIYEDRLGTLWVSTAETPCLHEYDRLHDRFIRRATIVAYSILEGKNNRLWIGTSAGLASFDRKSDSLIWVSTDKDGLGGNSIYGILEDDHGNLWLSTNRGLCKYNPNSHAVRSFTPADGYPLAGIKQSMWGFHGYCKKNNGEMIIGGSDGIVVFHPDSIRDNPYIPPIVITAFKKFDKLVLLDSAISETRHVELSYKENVFSFEFAALNYTGPENNQYAYKLEGFDNDWIYCGTRRYATYTNLDGGRYTFRVKGSNNDGVWNESGTSIAVIITPPFWATWWFRVFGFVAILLSVGGSIRYVEMKKLKRKIEQLENERALERERTRISQDMHDEVGASLTEIAILSELAQKEMGDKSDTAGAHIRKIADRSREVVDSMSEIIWTINPKNDHLNDLLAYLHQYAMLFLKSTAIRCRFESPETTPDFTLSAEVRRHIFLVVKEALHNVVKHSHATETTVRCGFGEGMIEISVEDNGRGFALEQISRFGNGVLSMRKRIEDIGGTFTIDSHQGGGTKVCISVPIAVPKA